MSIPFVYLHTYMHYTLHNRMHIFSRSGWMTSLFLHNTNTAPQCFLPFVYMHYAYLAGPGWWPTHIYITQAQSVILTIFAAFMHHTLTTHNANIRPDWVNDLLIPAQHKHNSYQFYINPTYRISFHVNFSFNEKPGKTSSLILNSYTMEPHHSSLIIISSSVRSVFRQGKFIWSNSAHHYYLT